MTINETNREPGFEGARAALEFATWSLNEQLEAIRQIDTKSQRVFTLAVAILVLLSGAGTLPLSDRPEWPIQSVVAGGITVLFFIVAVWFFFHAQAATDLYLGPKGAHLLAIFAAQPDLRTRQWLAESIYGSIEHNAQLIHAKSKRYVRLTVAVLAEAILAGIAVLYLTSA